MVRSGILNMDLEKEIIVKRSCCLNKMFAVLKIRFFSGQTLIFWRKIDALISNKF